MYIFLICAVIVIIIDQLTKYIVQRYMMLGSSIPLVDEFVRLTYVQNPHAAFGISLLGGNLLLIFVSAVAIVVIIFIFYRRIVIEKWKISALGLILGGAVGNLVDRLRFGKVIDFVDIGYHQYRWPVFNVADIAITIGGILLVIFIVTER